MTGPASGIAAAVLIVAAGLPLAYALVRVLPLALLLAPLVAALMCALAVMLMLATGIGALIGWLAVTLIVALGITAWALRGAGPPAPYGSWVDLACYTLPLAPPLLAVATPPGGWDAHSIWWLHAAGYTHGAGFGRQMMAGTGLEFSHLDYPPMLSAAVGAGWEVLGGHDFRLAQVVSALLTASAIGLVGYAVRTVTGAAPAAVSRLAGIGASLGAWSTAPEYVAAGYADALWSAAMVGGAVLILLGRHGQVYRAPGLPVVLLTAAALTKNEGLVAAGILAVLVSVRDGRTAGAKVWWWWLPVAIGAGSAVLARLLGAGSGPPAGTGGPGRAIDRVGPSLLALWGQVGVVVALAIVVAILGRSLLRRPREAMGLRGDGPAWILLAGYLLSLVITYARSDLPLDWWLRNSVDRVSTMIVLMACALTACWAAVAFPPPRTAGQGAAGRDLQAENTEGMVSSQ